MKCNLREILSSRAFQPYFKSCAPLIVVSAVPSLYVFNLLFSSPSSLPGVDPAHHIIIVRWIFNSRNILVPYSQFLLADVGYYPALWQAIIALLHSFTGINEVDLIRYFIFSTFLFGESSYWLLSKELSDGNHTKGVFLYFALLFSIAPLIKTLRDGSYGEIVGMWFLLPLFLLFHLRHKMICSAVVLTFMTATHNLSTLMTGLLVLSFLITYSLHREWEKAKFTVKVIGLASILSFPFLFYDYFIPILSLMRDHERFNSFTRLHLFDFPLFLSPLTFYTGLTCSIIIYLFHKRYRWLCLWFGTYLIASIFPNARIVRDMCIPLSLSMGIVLYDAVKNVTRGIKIKLTYEQHVKEYDLPKSAKMNSIILLLISLVIAYNGIECIASESAPVVTDYFTPLKAKSYSWLNAHTTNMEGTIVIRALDSWARVYLEHTVYEVVAPVEQGGLSAPDRSVNDELTTSLLNPFSFNAFSTFQKYNISHFILSTPLSERWYSYSVVEFTNMLLKINYESIPFYKIIYHEKTDDEMIKIYKILYPQSPSALHSMPIVKDNSIILRNTAGEGIIKICFWETELLFDSDKYLRLFGHPSIENFANTYAIHSEILSNSLLTTTSFKNSSHKFIYEVTTRSSEKTVIINVTLFTNLSDLNRMGIGLSCNSTNYVIFTPTGKSLEYDNKTNEIIEAEGFEVIQFDNSTTVIIHTGSRTKFQNLFEWNVIRPELKRDRGFLDVIILSSSETFVADGAVFVRYDNLVKPVQQVINELLDK